MKTSQLDYLIVYLVVLWLCLPYPLWWIGKTFWQVIRIIDLACVGDHAYYEVTMPTMRWPCLCRHIHRSPVSFKTWQH